MRIGIVVPHMFMHQDILPHVIFSPGHLALNLANGLQAAGHNVTLFTPGPILTQAKNINADLSLFEDELVGRDYGYTGLLKKHPQIFITLARQVQAEIISRAFQAANEDELDIVHIYTNEEELGMVFAQFCRKPIVFTHHDPFNYLIRYKSIMPKYKHLPWISMSLAQRAGMPNDTNWVANIYHGLTADTIRPVDKPRGGYVAFIGRIIEAKGVHLAIQAVKEYNRLHGLELRLKIAGKHYAGHGKDTYWQEKIEPELNEMIQYVGFLDKPADKESFLANAEGLLMPSLFPEPFGMVSIEALAAGTPVIGLGTGAIPEVIEHGRTGYVIPRSDDEQKMTRQLVVALGQRHEINRTICRQEFEKRFTIERMVTEHSDTYQHVISLI